MGEKKLGRYLTFDELSEIYGWTKGSFYKRSSFLKPALLKIGGVAPKPHKFDIQIIEKIISADAKVQIDKPLPARLRKRRSMKSIIDDDSGESWR